MQILMALFRVGLTVWERVSDYLYQKRVAQKQSLKVSMAQEYSKYLQLLRNFKGASGKPSPKQSPGISVMKTRGTSPILSRKKFATQPLEVMR